MTSASDPTATGDEPERDWFGYRLDRPREPVPCPRCDATFTDAGAFEGHLRHEHAEAHPRGRPVERGEQPALGRNRRSPLSRRLHTIPLVLVVTLNVALIIATMGALAAVGPPAWDELMDQTWGLVVLVPMLWPTIVFLGLRGMHDI